MMVLQHLANANPHFVGSRTTPASSSSPSPSPPPPSNPVRSLKTCSTPPAIHTNDDSNSSSQPMTIVEDVEPEPVTIVAAQQQQQERGSIIQCRRRSQSPPITSAVLYNHLSRNQKTPTPPPASTSPTSTSSSISVTATKSPIQEEIEFHRKREQLLRRSVINKIDDERIIGSTNSSRSDEEEDLDEDRPLDLSVGTRRRDRTYSNGTEDSDDSGAGGTSVDFKDYKKNLMKRYCEYSEIDFFTD